MSHRLIVKHTFYCQVRICSESCSHQCISRSWTHAEPPVVQLLPLAVCATQPANHRLAYWLNHNWSNCCWCHLRLSCIISNDYQLIIKFLLSILLIQTWIFLIYMDIILRHYKCVCPNSKHIFFFETTYFSWTYAVVFCTICRNSLAMFWWSFGGLW